jgi:hypothetical protein
LQAGRYLCLSIGFSRVTRCNAMISCWSAAANLVCAFRSLEDFCRLVDHISS